MQLQSVMAILLVTYVPSAGSVDGLYAGFNTPHTQVSDFSTVVYRQQLLGFNTVRLPFRYAGSAPGACMLLKHSPALCPRQSLTRVCCEWQVCRPGCHSCQYHSLQELHAAMRS